MDECLDRLRTLIGKDNVSSLEKKKVAIIGLGGVGGYVLDSLARTGISRFVLCDHDNFEKSNINRQLLSLSDNIGKRKVDVAKERVMSINPDAECTTYYEFFSEANAERILSETDIVIDAIDSVPSKIALIKRARNMSIPVVSSMGAANKLDITKIRIADISETYACPLAKKVRTGLRKEGIENGVIAVFSSEEALKNGTELGSLSTIVAVFGEFASHAALSLLLSDKRMIGGKNA